MVAQKYVKLCILRMTLKNTNLHNMKFPVVISQFNVIDNYATVRKFLVVIDNWNSIGN